MRRKNIRSRSGQPVAVLSHNRPAFDTVSPELVAQIAELYGERELSTLVESRLKSVSRAVKVNLDEL
jgi:antitoxin StbD